MYHTWICAVPRLLAAVEFEVVDTLSNIQIFGYIRREVLHNGTINLFSCPPPNLRILPPAQFAVKIAREKIALTTIYNPHLDTESYIYIYGPDRWITSPNVTIVSTKVVQIMDTRLDEGRKRARRCTLAIKYEVVPRIARVKVKVRSQLPRTLRLRVVDESLVLNRYATTGATHSTLPVDASAIMQIPAMSKKKF